MEVSMMNVIRRELARTPGYRHVVLFGLTAVLTTYAGSQLREFDPLIEISGWITIAVTTFTLGVIIGREIK
jgi:hypothetical protein